MNLKDSASFRYCAHRGGNNCDPMAAFREAWSQMQQRGFNSAAVSRADR
jgi:hypothetical protein